MAGQVRYAVWTVRFRTQDVIAISLTHFLQSCLFAAFLISECIFASPGLGGVNAPEQAGKPYLILVSVDGFRWDYPDLFQTQAINRLAARGIMAEALVPVYPTVTFPNHYSMVTGLFPARHGIVANEFKDKSTGKRFVYKQESSTQDGSWYGGEPVWVAAEKAGMVTAAYFFVGTEAEIQGVRPTHWRAYDSAIGGEARIRQVLEWLREPVSTRPHFYTLYFEDVDAMGHLYGPMSAENAAAVRRVDGYIQLLLDGIAALPYSENVSVVLVSDHGQLPYDQVKPPFIVSDHFDVSGIDAIDNGTFVNMYFKPSEQTRRIALRDGINRVWDCGRAYLPQETPTDWNINDNPRFAELFLQAEPGCAVYSSRARVRSNRVANHGLTPDTRDMWGIFIAAGAGLPAGMKIAPVRAVDVYPLLMHLLGLKPRQDVDSTPGRWSKWFR